ncbi:hypothetical protein LSAT2_013109 [Lamellibrachia satsuma]|nr:hypothetical protein LSAT2_013109 [Lamellibrachia satsuma]
MTRCLLACCLLGVLTLLVVHTTDGFGLGRLHDMVRMTKRNAYISQENRNYLCDFCLHHSEICDPVSVCIGL